MAGMLADEHVPNAILWPLRAAGHDIVHLRELGLANRGLVDRDVLAVATEQGRAVVTANRKDYRRLHKRGVAHAGILAYVHEDDRTAVVRRLLAAIAAHEPLAGKLIVVCRPPQGTRVEP